MAAATTEIDDPVLVGEVGVGERGLRSIRWSSAGDVVVVFFFSNPGSYGL